MNGNAHEFPSEEDRKMAANRMELVLLTIAGLVKDVASDECRYGHPCSVLIETAQTSGIRALVRQLLFLQGVSGELGLNAQGLKLYWKWYGANGGLKFRVGEKQERFYPQTVSMIKKLITDNGWGY